VDRRELRTRLLQAAPWLDETEFGPRSVDAGTCELCARHPRLLPSCGPRPEAALCRDCAETLGDDAWCDGHLDDGRAGTLPERWADLVVLWWVATGEIRVEDAPPLAAPETLPPQVRAVVPRA
jgi:hypothetical protein